MTAPPSPPADPRGHDRHGDNHALHDRDGHGRQGLGAGHARQRGHGHDHRVDPAAGDTRVAAAIAVNLLLTVAQIVGGIVAGSLALVADALHNLSDALSLLIAFAARKIARRASDDAMTFGYGRIEMVAALVNYTTLAVLGLWLGSEAVRRLVEPERVDGVIVVAVAGLALAIDVVTAVLVFGLSRTSANMRAAFLHNVADALGSVAVIGAGVLVILFDWRLADPLVTMAIAGYILWLSLSEVGAVIRVLMLGAPPGIATGDVVAAVRAVDGVSDVHRTRFWQVGEREAAFDAHVVIDEGAWSRADAIKADVKRALADGFGITASTLELECAVHARASAPAYGPG